MGSDFLRIPSDFVTTLTIAWLLQARSGRFKIVVWGAKSDVLLFLEELILRSFLSRVAFLTYPNVNCSDFKKVREIANYAALYRFWEGPWPDCPVPLDTGQSGTCPESN